MRSRVLAGMTPGRLRLVMIGFFLALAIPTAVLVNHAYGQLKWEAFHQHRLLAEEMTRRIDARFSRLLADEENRGFGDYAFLVVEGDAESQFLSRSALSEFPVDSEIPGIIGWFQVDSDGRFSTPLLPSADTPVHRFRMGEADRAERARLAARIQSILSENRLVGAREFRGAAELQATREPKREAELESDEPMRGQRPDRDERFDGIKSVIGVERGLAASRAPSPAPAAEPSGLGAGTASESPGEVRAREKAAPPSQAAFDRLNTPSAPSISGKQSLPGSLGRIEDLKLDSPYAESAEEQQRASEERDMAQRLADTQMKKKLRSVRKEYALPTPLADDEGAAVMSLGATASASADTPASMPSARPPRIDTFESELDPFEFSVLDSGHFVLFRKVWRDGQRFIQGALIEQSPFLAGLVGASFRDSALSRMSKVAVAWRGDVFAAFSGSAGRSLLASADELSGSLLHRTRLSAPLAEMELVYSVTRLPAGPGARVIAWTSAVLALVLVAGVWLMYRLGARQIALARQQQDFVSAVSHELKTPLTSIRMYAEMLKEGWSSEEKKRSYYEFIVQESERLSRLIANVLQLARMTRNEVAVQLREVAVSELMDGVRSTLVSQVEHAGFELQVDCDERAASASLLLDTDAFSQCLINLVDNALKFSAGCERKAVCVTCRLAGDGHVDFAVRDFGPGVPRDQMRKIFTLFYRSENELTRETVGTGIGLALVHQLARAMHGRVDVSNAEPGAVFTLSFRARSGS